MVPKHRVFLFLSLIWRLLVLQGWEEMGAKGGAWGKRFLGRDCAFGEEREEPLTLQCAQG